VPIFCRLVAAPEEISLQGSNGFDDFFGGRQGSEEISGKSLQNRFKEEQSGGDIERSKSPVAEPVIDGKEKVVPGDVGSRCSRERYTEIVGRKGALGDPQQSGDVALDRGRSVKEVQFGLV
jgi:hypothetical protein